MKNRSISMRPGNRGRGVRQERQTDPVPVSEKLVNTVSVASTDRALSDGSLASHSVTFVCQECAQGNGLQPDVDFNDAFTNEEIGLTVPVREQHCERIIPFSSPCSMIIEED